MGERKKLTFAIDGKKVLILPILLWLVFLLLLWLTSNSNGGIHYLFLYLLPFYLFAIPFGMVKFIEKQSIIKRFGLEPERLLFLILLGVTAILAILNMTAANWIAFNNVLWAPIPEEVFFRGYILGRLSKGIKSSDSAKVWGSSLILSAAIFSSSHAFTGDPPVLFAFAFLFGCLAGLIYLLTRSILFPAAMHTAYNLLTSSGEGILPIQFLFWAAIILFPSCFLLLIEWLEKRKEDSL